MTARLELTDSRRLTGANLFWNRPSAIIDVHIEHPGRAGYKQEVAETWREAATLLLKSTGCRSAFNSAESTLSDSVKGIGRPSTTRRMCSRSFRFESH